MADEHKQAMQKLQAEQREKVKRATVKRGIWICNTGDGKGKSTAAFGTALRALGHGQRVGIVQFIKGTWKTGEGKLFAQLPGLTHIVSGDGFTWNTQDKEQDIASAKKGLEAARQLIQGAHEPPYDLVILDEVHIALRYGYLTPEEVTEVCLSRPEAMSMMTTGRDAPDLLMERADTVTEMREVKHAFRGGIAARKGVDF